MDENRRTIYRYPQPLLNYMIDQRKIGRIFNDYGVGGYLIYHLSPNTQIYIDGRTGILYPPEHLQRYKALFHSASELKSEIKKYDVDQIMLLYDQSIHDLVYQVGDFGLDFVGPRFALYTRESPNFPLLFKLMAQPACWRPEMAEALKRERHKMDELLPYNSALYPFADFVVAYSNAEHWEAFFDVVGKKAIWTDQMRRFAAYRALEAGDNDRARIIFSEITVRKPRDNYASAMAMIADRNPQEASRILATTASIEESELEYSDFYLRILVYETLAYQKELTSAELELWQHYKERLVNKGLTRAPGEGSFCQTPGMIPN
jgi:hypothetical protein